MLRRMTALLGCVAMLPHVAVPAGYMLDRDPQSGALTYILCSGQGPVRVPAGPDPSGRHDHDAGHGGHHDGADSGTPDEPANAPAGGCVFAAAFAPITAAPENPHGLDRTGTVERPPAPADAMASDRSWVSQRARAPPEDS